MSFWDIDVPFCKNEWVISHEHCLNWFILWMLFFLFQVDSYRNGQTRLTNILQMQGWDLVSSCTVGLWMMLYCGDTCSWELPVFWVCLGPCPRWLHDRKGERYKITLKVSHNMTPKSRPKNSPGSRLFDLSSQAIWRHGPGVGSWAWEG